MIDRKLLPSRCMLDTGVWIRALGERHDERSAACRAFFEAMIEQRHVMLMAAPTLAEMMRGGFTTTLPSTRSIHVVPLDRRAALLLGSEFPQSILKTVGANTGTGTTYMKYDAMILACAKRWGVSMFIAYDDDHVRLAQAVGGIHVCRPDEFEAAQGVLAFARRS